VQASSVLVDAVGSVSTATGTRVLATHVLPLCAEEAARIVCGWATAGLARAVCASNVHMLMEAHDDRHFAAALDAADLVVCDGRPLVWAARLQGVDDARQCRGLDLTMAVCDLATRRGLTIGLYGGEAWVNEEVRRRLQRRFPGLAITYCWSPPFRELTEQEDLAAAEALAAADPDILFVSLGCPRQERWMLSHRDRIPCVMLGVGAVFDMIAGRVRVAPRWMQRSGLEWAFRLGCEPRRLWRRYARHNARFVALVLAQQVRRSTSSPAQGPPSNEERSRGGMASQ
jgi:N-acetylglucosaminyldiphosphoundecaprenol N-acetyl-beta-D-mannosaminyltransferase